MTTGNDKQVEVVVYTDAAEVELFFTPADGGEARSLGKKKLSKVTSEGGKYTYRVYKARTVPRPRLMRTSTSPGTFPMPMAPFPLRRTTTRVRRFPPRIGPGARA